MCKVQLRNKKHARLREARNKVLESLAADAAINNQDAVLETSDLQNKIEEEDMAIQEPLQIILTGDERSKHDAEWRSYQDRKGDIQRHRGNAFSITRVQCQKVLIEKMESDPDWEI